MVAEKVKAPSGFKPIATWRHYCFFVSHYFCFTSFSVGSVVTSQFLYDRIRRIHLAQDPSLNFTESANSSTCTRDTNSSAYKFQQSVQGENARWNQYFSVSTGVPNIFIVLISGALCDVLGRKFLALFTMLGVFARFTAYVIVVWWNLSLSYLFIGYIFEGCTGGVITHLVAVYAYAADIIPDKKTRTFVLVVLDALRSLLYGGISFGSGYFIEATGFFYPILTVSFGLFISIIIMALMAQETIVRGNINDLKPHKTIQRVVNFYITKNASRWKYWVILIVFGFISQIFIGIDAVMTLYELNSPFCWTPVKIGMYVAVTSVVQPLIGSAAVKLLQRYMSGEIMAAVCMLTTVLMFIILGIANSDWMLYLAAIVGAPGVLSFATVRAILSSITKKDVQGAALAGLGTIEAVCIITSSVMLNSIYAATLYWMKGFVFVFVGVICIIPIGLLIGLDYGMKKEQKEQYKMEIFVVKKPDGGLNTVCENTKL